MKILIRFHWLYTLLISKVFRSTRRDRLAELRRHIDAIAAKRQGMDAYKRFLRSYHLVSHYHIKLPAIGHDSVNSISDLAGLAQRTLRRCRLYRHMAFTKVYNEYIRLYQAGQDNRTPDDLVRMKSLRESVSSLAGELTMLNRQMKELEGYMTPLVAT